MRIACVILVCALGLPGLGCRSRACGPRRLTTPALEALLARIRDGGAEARYHAVLELAHVDGEAVRTTLRALLDSDEILTRNAAARVLVEMGETTAVTTLIANLDRANRTYAVTDAIHHLRGLYGTDRSYDPNRGYRAQTEAQEAWWTWWQATDLGGTRPAAAAPAETRSFEAAFVTLRPKVDAYLGSPPPTDRTAAWAATEALWAELADLQASREPHHVALLARAFAAMSARWPTSGDLANNHALAALNDGRYADAEASYRRALALAPDTAYFHNDYGILLEGLGRFDEAAAQYREAIRLAPEDPVWWSNLGDVLRALDRPGEARAAYRRAETLAPETWYYHRLWIGRLPPP